MLYDKLFLMASDLRARAEEISSRAEAFNDAGARQKLRRIAATLEKLASRLEQRARDADRV